MPSHGNDQVPVVDTLMLLVYNLTLGKDPLYELQAWVDGLDGRAIGAVLDSGDMIKGGVYIAATGIKPNVDYLKDSGLALNWGVPVDETLSTNLAGTSLLAKSPLLLVYTLI